ncbi:MAG TPA: ABC transporter substrate-binding protein [Xanthobacteraceae bacterium]|nr:ABC transporter substrate-binding protein [Xanthobacteraceae bacterium]
MKRREFITGLGMATLSSWPRAARAQQPAMPVIGYLQTGTPDSSTHQLSAFRQGLSDAGYAEGRNVMIEYRFAQGQYDRLPAMAAEFARRRVTVIVAVGGARPAFAAKAATSTIPIVFAMGDTDPVQAGLVTSLSRPGGNLTGVAAMLGALTAKRVGLLRELIPKESAVAMLANPDTVSVAAQIEEAQKAARTIGIALHVVNASNEGDFETAFAVMAQRKVGALLVSADAFYGSRRPQIIALADRHAIPANYYRREFVEEGGLMSYAAPLADMYRQAGLYAGRVLGGAKPADLPVVQPTKFELVVNLKTAKLLGLEIPTMLRVLADEVIE